MGQRGLLVDEYVYTLVPEEMGGMGTNAACSQRPIGENPGSMGAMKRSGGPPAVIRFSIFEPQFFFFLSFFLHFENLHIARGSRESL